MRPCTRRRVQLGTYPLDGLARFRPSTGTLPGRGGFPHWVEVEERLGGFKILKDVVWTAMAEARGTTDLLMGLCRKAARERINIVFLSLAKSPDGLGMILAVEAEKNPPFRAAVEGFNAVAKHPLPTGVVLSIFPHRTKPEVAGRLLESLGKAGVYPPAFASSASAVSALIPEHITPVATGALFTSFSFSAYRTPEDWKLAQEGKERLYREVVASYQEKSPKVYSLDWMEPLVLMKVRMAPEGLASAGAAFKHFASMGIPLSFLVSAPDAHERSILCFCLPGSDPVAYADILSRHLPEASISWTEPAALFSMNGPHFGDRHGLAAQLMEALSRAGIELLAMGCAIASISGVVPSPQGERATEAICTCFEVPTVNRKAPPTA